MEGAHKKIVKALLKAHADVNRVNGNEMTPLYLASREGHVEIVKTLLKARADVNRADKHGVTPLYLASKERHTEIGKALQMRITRVWDPHRVRLRQEGHGKKKRGR